MRAPLSLCASSLPSFAPPPGLAAREADQYDLVVCASVGPSLLDQAALTAITKILRPGGSVEVRELVWKSRPTAAASAPRVKALRDAESLRRALLFAGLTPSDAAPEASSLGLGGVPAADIVAALYPSLAFAATNQTGQSPEAADALGALGAQLVPMLGICTLRAAKPAYAANGGGAVSFSLKSPRLRPRQCHRPARAKCRRACAMRSTGRRRHRRPVA
jgi:hypothetical protein